MFRKIFIIAILSVIQHPAWLNGQISGTVGPLVFEDTLSLDPLHDWLNFPYSDTGLWEICEPDKPDFNSAHTGNKAILTDPAGYYGVNCDEAFYLSIPLTRYFWGEGILSFYHRYDSDSLRDGGTIEVSYDGGSSWINIKEDKYHIATNFIGLYEDTITGGIPGFSGRSAGWEYVELYWWWIALVKKFADYSDSLLIKFRFISDSIDNKMEGWMIDDLVFRGYELTGSDHNPVVDNFRFYPVPVSDEIIFDTGKPSATDPRISIFNVSGQMVRSASLRNNRINVADLKKGTYIFEICYPDKTIYRGKFQK